MSELMADRVPRGEASTAAVKPAVEVGPQVVDAFVTSCERLLRVVDGAGSLKTTVCFAHPWFGPLDAEGWFFMAGFHLRLHRKQVERILAVR